MPMKCSSALTARLAADRAAVDALLDAPAADAAWQVRDVVDRLSRTWQALCLDDLAPAA